MLMQANVGLKEKMTQLIKFDVDYHKSKPYWSSKSCQRWHHQCVSSLRGHELESIKIHVQFSLQCRVFSSMFIHSCCTFAACSVCFIWGFTSETGSEVFRCHQVWLSECHIQFQSLVGSAQTELTSCHPARKTCWSRHLC